MRRPWLLHVLEHSGLSACRTSLSATTLGVIADTSGPCPRCSSNTDRKASRPRALLQTAPHRPVGAGHARDALRARTEEHRAPGRSYKSHHTPCRSGPRPRCSSNTDGRASRPRALLQSAPHHPVGAGHARDAFLPTRTEKHLTLGRSYSTFAPIPNPHRIPERVVAHAFHQPCPDGIGDQITRGPLYVIVPT